MNYGNFLKELATLISRPWVILGKFNHLLHTDDIIGGAPVTLQDTMDFQQCIQQAGLQDIAWKGCRYSWTNKQEFR